MKKYSLLLLAVMLFVNCAPVFAQGETPHVLSSTRPISDELRGYLNDWLASSAPVNTPYYIVTYTEARTTLETFVSLVAANLSSPEDTFSFAEPADVLWMGTVIVSSDGTVTPETPVTMNRVASPFPAAGGGSYVAFPFATGTTAMYGSRAVHGAGYGTSGMQAVDLVGGDAMGGSVMPPKVFASDAGTVDYVCDDGTSVAVRTHNSTTGDYFIYAHMLDNANLAMSHTFARGEYMGALKYGSFNPTSPNCGWASQNDNQYHVHWGFVPAGGLYQVGGCVLTISTKKWACGNTTVIVGGYLTGGGGFNTDTSGSGDTTGGTGAGQAVTDPTFFDYVLIGITTVMDRAFVRLLPDHANFEYAYMLYNTVKMTLRLVWVLVQSNINLGPVIVALSYTLGLNFVLFAVWLVSAIFKALKSLVPLA